MSAITLTLPWVMLCPDNRKAVPIRGRIRLSPRYRMAKELAGMSALFQMRSARQTAFPPNCALSMSVTLYPPDKRRRDVVNVAKNLHDSLEGVCYADDAQLDEVTYRRGPLDRANARAEIVIAPLSPD